MSAKQFLSLLLLMLAAAAVRAAATGAEPEMKTVLEPMVVTEIRPLLKLAEHPVIEARYGAAVVAEGDYLYLIGGGNESGTRLDTVERIDLRTGHAEPWARLRIARRFHRAVILNGKIYVLGGTVGRGTAFDPLTEELADYPGDDPPIDEGIPPSPLAPPENLMLPPSAKQHRVERNIAQAGNNGFGFSYVAEMEEIDLATGRVSLGPPMPVPKALFGCVVVGGKIMVIGGQKLRNERIVCTSTTEVFDPATGRWDAGVNLPMPRRGAACVADGFVIFAGGYGGLHAGRTIEVFNPREGFWRRLPDLAEPVNPYATVWAGNYLFFFGDQAKRSRQLAYDLRAKRLVPYPLPLPDADLAAAILHHDHIYVVGGANPRLHEATGTIQEFALTAGMEKTPPAAAGK